MTLPTITPLPTPPSRSDTPTTFNSLADAFLGAFPLFQSELNAWAAALPAEITGTDFAATSTTSLAIGTGSKSLTIQTGKGFQIGQPVRIASTSTPANYMDGQVTAHDSGTGALTVNVATVGGSGTIASWTISILPAGAGSFVTLTGAETLTNKILTTPTLSGTASGTTAGRVGYSAGLMTYGDGSAQRTLVNTDAAQTLTNKTINTAGSNTIKVNGNTLAASAGTGTITFFNSSDTVVGRNTTDTLTNKTLTAPTIMGGTVGVVASPAANNVGTLGIPQRAITASTTLAMTDMGQDIYITGTTASQSVTIPANASVAFPIGTVIAITNDSNQNWTIQITSDTLMWSPSGSTGSRTLAQYGSVTIRKVTATKWWITGTGLS